jgi:hypothetical protein
VLLHVLLQMAQHSKAGSTFQKKEKATKASPTAPPTNCWHLQSKLDETSINVLDQFFFEFVNRRLALVQAGAGLHLFILHDPFLTNSQDIIIQACIFLEATHPLRSRRHRPSTRRPSPWRRRQCSAICSPTIATTSPTPCNGAVPAQRAPLALIEW